MRFNWLMSLAFVVVLGAGIGAASLVASESTSSLQGRVVDAETGAPVPSVQVFVDGLEVGGLTGPGGVFSLTGVQAGERTIVFRHGCYHRVAVQAEIEADSQAPIRIDLGLPYRHDRPSMPGDCPR